MSRPAIWVVVAGLLLAAPGCSPSPTDHALANNADTMDHNMAMKADKLQSMADDTSNAIAENMMDDVDASMNAAIVSNGESAPTDGAP
ncbi:MAG: hypothetical protein ACKVOB_12305 [Sphingomonas sp.]